MKVLGFLVLVLASPTANAAGFSLNGNEANLVQSILRQAGAPTTEVGGNVSTMVSDLTCIAGRKNDGSPFAACGFRSSAGSKQVPSTRTSEFMWALGRSGLPDRDAGPTVVYRVKTLTCVTYGANSPAPRPVCSLSL